MVGKLVIQAVAVPESFHGEVFMVLHVRAKAEESQEVEVAVPVKVGNGGIIGRSYQYPHETRIIPGLQKTCLKVKAQATRGCVPENPYPAVCICKNVHPAVTVIIGGDHPFL